MKRTTLFTSSLLLLTFSFAPQVHAAPSYWAAAYTDAAKADKSGGAALTSYSGYYCTVETATALFGGNTVDYVTAYFANNYASGVSALKTESAKYPGAGPAGALGLSLVEYDHGQYALNSTYGDSLASFGSAYLAVLLYSTGDAKEFRVMSGDATELANGNAYFNDDGFSSSGTAGAWTTVPEPTSGLLVLLGLAGMALKRRRI